MTAEFIARLGKDKKRDITFPRTETVQQMVNGTMTDVTKQISDGTINEHTKEAEVNMDEIRRLETMINQGYVELFTLSGAPVSLIDVLYDGVTPDLTPAILRHMGRAELSHQADQFAIETREVTPGDDEAHDKSTRQLRGELIAFVQSSKYKVWKAKHQERLERESVEDRVEKAVAAAKAADEARDLAEKQLAEAEEKLRDMEADEDDDDQDDDDDDDEVDHMFDDVTVGKTGAAPGAEEKTDAGEGDKEPANEGEFTTEVLMRHSHADLQEAAKARQLDGDYADKWKKAQLAEFIQFKEGIVPFEEITDDWVKEAAEDFIEKAPAE